MKTLRLILGDQLSHQISALRGLNASTDMVMLCEVMEEATYVKHHQLKIAFIFSAMRHFAEELKKNKIKTHYVTLDDPLNSQSFDTEVARAIKLLSPSKLIITMPGEYRVYKKILHWQKTLSIPVELIEDDRYFCTIDEFKSLASEKEHIRLEYFYRYLRKKTGILMNPNKTPIGGKWNYDKDNRHPLKNTLSIPKRKSFKIDTITKEVMGLINQYFNSHFGSLDHFYFAVTRAEALKLLDAFIKDYLPHFGDYQDAMQTDEPFLFHSVLSPYLNIGLLSPKEVCLRAVKAYEAGTAPLNAVEGFIRQILGWREFIRGVYWLKMPSYAKENFFKSHQPLPEFYWTGATQMNCLQQAISQTKNYAYSHHIQRLMITGNFALLSGLSIQAVCEWYLLVYADAYEWVELPNTLGMALYADGGFLASKPYAASGNYIHRMSNFCETCIYNPKETVGASACPFNSLYWHFINRNENTLKENQRLQFTFATWKKMPLAKRKSILSHAKKILDHIDEY